jgi:hypothetical protein
MSAPEEEPDEIFARERLVEALENQLAVDQPPAAQATLNKLTQPLICLLTSRRCATCPSYPKRPNERLLVYPGSMQSEQQEQEYNLCY